MKIFRYSFLYILVLACNFLFLLRTGYADQGDMYCDGWLREEAGNYPTEKDPNESNRTFIKDKKGVKGVCRRKFPTVGEREMLYRVNENSFNNTYKVKRQYCWYFGDWFGFDKCATPKIHIGFLYVHLGWDPPADINWGDDKEVQFGINDIGNDVNNDNNCKSIYGSFNHACVVRIGPGQEFPDGTVNNGNRIKVCAYYKSGWGFLLGNQMHLKIS